MSNRFPITIKGNLSSVPEVTVSGDGSVSARFHVVVDSWGTDVTGRRIKIGKVFHTVKARGRAAQAAAGLDRGAQVLVEGEVSFWRLEGDDAKSTQGWVVWAQTIALVVSPPRAESAVEEVLTSTLDSAAAADDVPVIDFGRTA